MKYLTFWEFSPEDMDKVIKKFAEYQKELEKNPDKYQTYIYPPHAFGGETKGFSIVEATPEQMVENVLYWTPLLRMKYKAIVASAKIAQQYLKPK